MITENLSTLKIHKLTQAQYERERDAGRLDENALYLTPDESVVIDETLSISGAAADAKAVGDAIADAIASADNSDIYVQNDEPTDAPDGSLWIDMDAEGSSGSGSSTGGTSSNIAIDTTLTQAGQAADARAVGDALATKQPIGDYLTKIPDEYITETELNSKGYLTEHQDISGKLDVSALPTAINTALAQAKASGEFDGAPGADGADYVLTDADKTEIAETVKAEVPLVKVAEQPTFVNSVEEMMDTSKVYVKITDGYMYRYLAGGAPVLSADDFTLCNVGTNGNLTSGNTRIATTNLLPIASGVSVNCPSPYQYFVYYFDASETYIGKTSWKTGSIDDVANDTAASGTKTDAVYCRISLRDSTNYQADLTGRIDEFMGSVVVQQTNLTGAKWTNTGLAYNQPPDYEDRIVELEETVDKLEDGESGYHSPLYKKTIVWDGDSICAGNAFDDTSGAWAGRIAVKNSMTYANYAVSGGTITENVQMSGSTVHSVCNKLATMHANYPDADYVIIEGGTNDADLLGSALNGTIPERFGSFSISDFSGNYDVDTFCGALESVFYRATQYWKGKKTAYIVAQKMGRNAEGYTSEVNNRRAYFETAMKICEKWGVPYLNLWDGCTLNPMLIHMYDTSKTSDENCADGSMYADGQHLTSAGYDFTASIIEAWLKTL